MIGRATLVPIAPNRSLRNTTNSQRSSRDGACAPFAFLLILACTLATFFVGCQKSQPRLNAAEIHAITHEFVTAANTVGVSTRGEFRTSDQNLDITDHIDATVRPSSADAEGRNGVANLVQALDDVAAKHDLTRDSPSETREGVAFQYLRGDFPTHTIHIHVAAASTQAVPQGAPAADRPRLAIILDDLGQDLGAADAIYALPYPLTISVLPNNPHSVEIAQEARRRGYEVMLHLPMESVSQRRAESAELRPGMSKQQVNALVNGFIEAVPGVAGVNNHQGSESTANVALMNELMPVLRDHKLFYIDSRTTAATVAFNAARRAGVPTAYRNVPFLDDVEQVSAISKQLRLALRKTREKGEAIAIGHPHPATLKALQEVLPEAKAEGIRLVYASDLVR